MYCVVFQEASGSEPQEDVVDRSKSTIEISGKMFTSGNFLHGLRKSYVKSLVVKAITLASGYRKGIMW